MAAVGVDIDLSGINRLAVDMGKVAGKTVPLAAAAVRKSISDIEGTAKMFCPVDTGNLRSSISSTVIGLSGETGPTAEYGIWVELGTSTQAPAAYMGPAFDRHVGEFELALARIAVL